MKLKPSPELSYLTGVMFGDGSMYYRPEKKKATYRSGPTGYIRLCAKSQEFVEAFNRCACRLKGREKPLVIYKSNGLFCVSVSSKVLYDFFKERNITKFRPVIEEFPADFIRGLFDSEGSVSFRYRDKKAWGKSLASYRTLDKRIKISNTNLQLLRYAQGLLREFDINSTITIDTKKGSEIGKYFTRKHCYCLAIWDKLGILRFIEKIGTNIPEKMDKLKTLASLLEYVRTCGTRSFRWWTDKETEVVVREYKRLTPSEIAKKIGRTTGAVKAKANYDLGIYRRGPYRTANQAFEKFWER